MSHTQFENAKIRETKTRVVVVTDAVKSSAQMAMHPVAATLRIASDLRAFSLAAQRHGGEVARDRGDGLLLFFPNALSALMATHEMLGAVREQNLRSAGPNEPIIEHRIGIQSGQVLTIDLMTEDGSEVLQTRQTGATVVEATRLQEFGSPSEITFSQKVYKEALGQDPLLPKKLATELLNLGPVSFKGLEVDAVNKIDVYVTRYIPERAIPKADDVKARDEDLKRRQLIEKERVVILAEVKRDLRRRWRGNAVLAVTLVVLLAVGARLSPPSVKLWVANLFDVYAVLDGRDTRLESSQEILAQPIASQRGFEDPSLKVPKVGSSPEAPMELPQDGGEDSGSMEQTAPPERPARRQPQESKATPPKSDPNNPTDFYNQPAN